MQRLCSDMHQTNRTPLADMILRVAVLLVFSSCLVAATDVLDGDQTIVSMDHLPYFEDEMARMSPVEQDDTNQQTEVTRSRRLKRSSWSLPPNTSVRYAMDWIIPVIPLNNTFTLFLNSLINRFILPTYTSLQTLYNTLGKFNDEKEDSNVIDLEFFEEQRANDERRTVYQYVEGLFSSQGYDGQTCLLRAICEMADTPLAHHGLLGKLIDLVFTPKVLEVPKTMESYLKSNRIKRDATSVPELELLQQPLEDDYTDAYRAGKEGKCWTRYYSCPVSLFHLVSFF